MMKQFLLLRSNKQSGPYSADELQQMGLKAYDLIWVDGKSAAWRYPGEVDELKAFAPPVEEQPYDRFYKKPEAEPKAQEVAGTPGVSKETPGVSKETPGITTPVISDTPSKAAQPAENKPAPKKEKEYKRIFVTLPSGASVQAPAPKPKPVAEEPTPPVFGTGLQHESLPAIQKETVRQPQREEIYYPSKRGLRIKPMMLATIVGAMICMVALGIFIGVSLDRRQDGVTLIKKTDPVNSNSTAPANEQNTASNTAAFNPSEPLVGEVKQDQEPVKQQNTVVPHTVKKNLPVTDSGQQVASAELPLKNDSDVVAQEKEEPAKKPIPKPAPNLEKMVAVSSNDYQVGPFGGISKLALTVKNSSDYNLNLVVVQVEYLKVNKEVFKTENLYFRDVAANSSLTLDAPRSSRGNKVNYKVTLINSKDHLYHAGN